MHNGVLSFRVKELVADRNGARGGGTGPWFRRSRCGFSRIPLRFDAPAVVSREFRCISMFPLWFRANSGLSWPLQAFSGGPLRLPTATARAVRRGLGFDAPAVVSREFRCVSMLPRCGFARIPLHFDAPAVVSREFRPLLGGPLRLPTATARSVRRCLGFDAPAVVSRELHCVSMLPLWFRANSVAFRCSRCGFARIPASRGLFRPLLGGALRPFKGLIIGYNSPLTGRIGYKELFKGEPILGKPGDHEHDHGLRARDDRSLDPRLLFA